MTEQKVDLSINDMPTETQEQAQMNVYELFLQQQQNQQQLMTHQFSCALAQITVNMEKGMQKMADEMLEKIEERQGIKRKRDEEPIEGDSPISITQETPIEGIKKARETRKKNEEPIEGEPSTSKDKRDEQINLQHSGSEISDLEANTESDQEVGDMFERTLEEEDIGEEIEEKLATKIEKKVDKQNQKRYNKGEAS